MAALPALPVKHIDFIQYLAANPKKPIAELAQPYRQYDAKIRELFAQEPGNPALKDPNLNVLPLFDGNVDDVKIRARDLGSETAEEKEKYIMHLKDDDRKPTGSPAVVQSLREFQNNFNVFSELSLADMDWNNVVAAGSSVVTSLLPTPEKYNSSKRALRQYYHEVVAPASDVDLFIYGLTEDEAIEKIKQIERSIREAILIETTTIRTKNAITIASQYPTRHIQIVLRIYKSVSEILTGFDVDCSCAAYDGKEVYVAPRALAAYMTQINQIDLTRRSPSYENRLSKYSHRGFEVYWPQLDRSRVDPTIFERSFQRTVGLARLLVLEKLPKSSDRDTYLDQRRQERGRPPINRYTRHGHKLRGNIKNDYEDEVAEWVEEDEVSDYHTFTIPYGEKFHARKIDKLLYTKDLLLNAEWNKPKDREVNLHRHPAFFGYAEDVMEDCCGFCPKPTNAEEEEVAEGEAKIYVSGRIEFIKDDPGRQAIGSFNPITDDDWTEMAYVGNTARLCQAIVDGDLEHVQDWLAQEGADPNQRDYTGRTPLHLAVMCSTPAIVKCLVNRGARLVARLADGRTALHIAAARGSVEMVKIIMEKSEANEVEEEMKQIRKRDERAASQKSSREKPKEAKAEKKAIEADDDDEDMENEFEDDDTDMLNDEDDEDAEMRSVTTGSYVRVDKSKEKAKGETIPDDDEDEPDFYDVNVVAWDSKCSPLHLAVVNGHIDVVKELCSTFGADVLLPIKFIDEYSRSPIGAVLTLVLALRLPWEQARQMVLTLIELGASSAQADKDGVTAFHYAVKHGSKALQLLFDNDKAAVQSAIKHFVLQGGFWNPGMTSPLTTALENNDTAAALKLLEFGISPELDFESWSKVAKATFEQSYRVRQQLDDTGRNEKDFKKSTDQPVIVAVEAESPPVVLALLELGANPNTLTAMGQTVIIEPNMRLSNKGEALLDAVRGKIKKLSEYSGEELYTQAPLELKSDDVYMKDLQPGTYKYWAASNEVTRAKTNYERDLKQYVAALKQHESRKGLQEKKDALKQLIKGFKEVEAEIVRRGGKTFKELYPDIKCTEYDRNFPHGRYRPELHPFELKFDFRRGDLTPAKREQYCELFQAAWDGDLATIKKLTLAPLGPDQKQPPLQIATMDSNNASPFSIAILRGHVDIAKAILEIAKAQYEPEEENELAKRYSIAPREYESDYDDDGVSTDSDDEGIRVYGEIVDDQFTIENIGKVSLQVKSRVTPLAYLKWCVDMTAFVKRDVVIPKPDSGIKWIYEPDQDFISMFGYAIFTDDLKLFKYLLDIGEAHTGTTEDNASRFFSVLPEDFKLAIRLGRTKHLAEIMRRTGAGIPLEELVKKSGVEIKEKPKYYQGLSIHGKKRADWAAAGRNVVQGTKMGSKHSPLLEAARAGSIESVEWMLSDAPIRHYLSFAETNKNDKRLIALSQAGGGIDKAIHTWYGAGSEFLLHCAVMAPTTDETIRLVKYLVKSSPSAVNKRSSNGLTPLSLTFSLARYPLAKLLIDAGGDQTIRDTANGYNLLHLLLVGNSGSGTPFSYSGSGYFVRHDVPIITKLLDLLDPSVLGDMFTQRNSYTSGAATPLHYWLTYTNFLCGCKDRAEDEEEMFKTLLKYSKGEELQMINGAGETPLHTLVTMKKFSLMRVLLDFNPMLLYRENATGRTPAEVAYDEYMADKVRAEPDLIRRWRGNNYGVSHADRNPESFVKSESGLAATGAWGICKEVVEKHAGKRRLVSLNEANEVARRLAETRKMEERNRYRLRKRGEEHGEEQEDEMEDTGDVVSDWWPKATDGWYEDEEDKVEE